MLSKLENHVIRIRLFGTHQLNEHQYGRGAKPTISDYNVTYEVGKLDLIICTDYLFLHLALFWPAECAALLR